MTVPGAHPARFFTAGLPAPVAERRPVSVLRLTGADWSGVSLRASGWAIA